MRVLPNFKPLRAAYVERCAHVQAQSHLAIHATVTLQPVTASPLDPVATLLCTRCALAVSEAIVAAMQASVGDDERASENRLAEIRR